MSQDKKESYKKLALNLNKMPIGFPPTKSGVEIKLLQELFTSIEAEIASVLKFAPEPLNKIRERIEYLELSENELEKILDGMYFKGLINRIIKKSDNVKKKIYSSAPLALGFFEYQVNHLTEDFIDHFEQYYDEGFIEELNKTGIPQLRTIPIGKSISYEQNIATYDELRKIIELSEGVISVANCVCRQVKDIKGDPCKKTDMRELCFQFRTSAKSFNEKGQARMISKEEALEILEKAEEAGLVLQPGNSQRPHCLCCCCGCCCEVLVNQKKMPNPAQFFATNYYAQVDETLCVSCGTCEEKCNMEAIMIEDIATIDLNRCIGCGACVPACPEDALSLKKKEDERIPPKDAISTYAAIMQKKTELADKEK